MQVVLNGLVAGSAIALLAVAFQAVYLPTRVFFLGLAGIYAAAPYVAAAVLATGAGWPVALFTSVLASAILALFLEWASHARLARSRAPAGAHLIASLGAYLVIVQVVAMIWGNDSKVLRGGLEHASHIGDVAVTGPQAASLGATVLLLGGFACFLIFSDLGLRLRALSDNPTQFALLGLDVDRYRLLAFALSGVFASASSLLTAYDIGFDPHAGMHAVLLAVVAVIIGGKGSFAGPVIGALLLGLLRAQVVWHWSARWQEAVTFALLAIFLLVRPQGLLEQKTRLEARE